MEMDRGQKTLHVNDSITMKQPQPFHSPYLYLEGLPSKYPSTWVLTHLIGSFHGTLILKLVKLHKFLR
jgi:hypothetical protein